MNMTKEEQREFEQEVLEGVLEQLDEPTKRLKCLMGEPDGLFSLMQQVWNADNLGEKITLRHLVLVQCHSILGQEAVQKLENDNAFFWLDHFKLGQLITERARRTGGRPLSSHTVDLMIKLLFFASYRWLLQQELKRYRSKYLADVRIKDMRNPVYHRNYRLATSAAINSVKRAYKLSRRVLVHLDDDSRTTYAAARRVLWEDKYPPIVLKENGLIQDVCF